MKNNKGFNLVELLIVVAIIGIIAAIAAPNLTNLVRKNRIENQTRRIYSDLSNARIKAMNNNMMHFFRFSGSTYTIFADTSITGADFSTYDGADTQVLQRGGADTVPFTFSNINPGNEEIGGIQVSFNARGLANQQGTVCIGGATMATQPSVNCVVVGMTRTRIGKISISNIAGACNATNCN